MRPKTKNIQIQREGEFGGFAEIQTHKEGAQNNLEI